MTLWMSIGLCALLGHLFQALMGAEQVGCREHRIDLSEFSDLMGRMARSHALRLWPIAGMSDECLSRERGHGLSLRRWTRIPTRSPKRS